MKTSNHVVLVTGATGGLVTAMCRKLFQEGYRVAANYRNREKAEEWKKKLDDEGINVELFEADVTDFDSVGKMVAEIESKMGSVDILVNNAGITRDGRFTKMTPDDWRAVMSTNLDSVFNCCRHV